MAFDAKKTTKLKSILGKVLLGLTFLAVVVLLLLWLAGTFHPKIDKAGPPSADVVPAGRPVGDTVLTAVRMIRVPRVEHSVGTIRAVHETAIASKLLARVIEVNVTAGRHVEKNDVLVRLDDADLAARLEQAEASAASRRAARDQAKIEYDRVKELVEKQAAARIEWDRVQTALKSAEAEVVRTEQAVAEARTTLAYATIRSPITGTVVDKKVEVGDTVQPGQILLTLYDPTRMQLVASVRESLTRRLAVGQSIGVEVDALKKKCVGQISEIVPEADSASRTFAVKVTGPCPPGIYSGMFGRLLIPLDDEEVLVVPQGGVRRIGQLDVVDVADGEVLRRRAVQLGREFENEVEVLAGLREGERVAVVPAEGRGER